MASKQSEQLEDALQGLGGGAGRQPGHAARRDAGACSTTGATSPPSPAASTMSKSTAGGVPALWAVPKGCAQDRVLLCTHGGGYVTGSMYTHRKVYGHLAKAIGCRALIVHYRRAPGERASGPGRRHGRRLSLAARSGHQAAAHRADRRFGRRRAGHHDVAAGARAGPADAGGDDAAVALARHGGDRRELRHQQREGRAGVARHHPGDGRRRSWAKAATAKDPLANPLHADLRGLPPVYIQVGGDETLLDDSRGWPKRAARRASRSRSTSSRRCSTSSTSWRASRRRRTTRSGSSLTGCARSSRLESGLTFRRRAFTSATPEAAIQAPSMKMPGA